MDNRSSPPPTDLPPESLQLVGVLPAEEMRGDDDEDAALLQQMLAAAKDYLFAFAWCNGVRRAYFGDGVGGVVAVFLFQIIPAMPKVDEWLWVVVGDFPSAYFVTDDLKNPHDVLESYIFHRQQWVDYASKNQTPPKTIMPVPEVPPTKEWADQLNSRLEILRKEFLPWFNRK